jgi:serine/alanine adding enzyme
MQIVDSLDEPRWARFVCEHPKGSAFHTPELAKVFRATKNYSPLLLAGVDEHDEILALLTSARVQSLPDPLGKFASRSIFYTEPICRDNVDGRRALAAIIAEHDRRMKSRVLFTEVRPLAAPGPEANAFAASGYDYEPYLNFLVDLRQPEEKLWRKLTNTCRANVRRAERHEVKVEEVVTEEGVEAAFGLLRATYQRAQVPLADKSLFLQAFRILRPQSMLKIFVAYHEKVPVGASVLLLYKKTVYEWYWGTERVRSLYPAECITWHRILWGKQNGFDIYDFGGAGWPDKPYGVRDFKAKFGGELVNYGRYRRIYSRWKFAVAEKTYDAVRKSLYSRLWKTA